MLDVSYWAIQGVHTTTHLPWVLSIPLTAVLVRMMIGFPLQIYTRRHARREQDLAPLTSALKRSSDVLKHTKGWTRVQSEARYQNRINHINRKFKLNRSYRFLPFVQVPVFITLMDSLRAMSGNNNGLIPWLLSWFDPARYVSSPQAGPHTTPAVQTPAETLPATESVLKDPATITDFGATSAEATSTADTVYRAIEPTLANEGALWFPDLLAGDTTGILPFLLTITILTNVNSGLRSQSAMEISRLPKIEMYRAFFLGPGLKSVLSVLAISAGLSSYVHQLPTALLLYWITSTNVATLQTKFLDKFMFTRPPISGYVPKYVRYEKAGDPFGLKLK